jgi:hypothetical protein
MTENFIKLRTPRTREREVVCKKSTSVENRVLKIQIQLLSKVSLLSS